MELPEEIIASILQFLPFFERERLRTVNSQWDGIITDPISSTKLLGGRYFSADHHYYYKYLCKANFENQIASRKQVIKYIDISGVSVGKVSSSQIILHILMGCKNLEYLNCSFISQFIPATIQLDTLISHEKLRVLKAKQGDAAILYFLYKLPNLTHLNINQKYKFNIFTFHEIHFIFNDSHEKIKVMKIKNLSIHISKLKKFIDSSTNLL